MSRARVLVGSNVGSEAGTEAQRKWGVIHSNPARESSFTCMDGFYQFFTVFIVIVSYRIVGINVNMGLVNLVYFYTLFPR